MFKIEIKDGKEMLAGTCKIVSNVTAASILGVLVLIMIGGAFISAGFVLLGIAGIIAVLLLNSILIVPTAWFGALTRFKQRIEKDDGTIVILEEGLGLGWPLVEDLLLENTKSKKLATKEVKAQALSKDKLNINLEGSVQFNPSDLNVFIEREIKTIEKGMIDAIESELGKICGVKDADVFVEKRSEVELLIQSILQLERPPHHYIDEAGEDENRQKEFVDDIRLRAKNVREKVEKVLREAEAQRVARVVENQEVIGQVEIKKRDELDELKVALGTTKVMGLVLKEDTVEALLKLKKIDGEKIQVEKIKEWLEKLSPEKWILKKEEVSKKEVPGEEEEKDIRAGEIDVVLFYKDNVSRIALLFEIKDAIGAKSQVERLYGIKVATFRLAKLSFSEEAQAAFEKVRSARAEMEAAEKRFQKKIKTLDEFLKRDISSADAVNLVETTTDVKGVERLIISAAAGGSQSVDIVAAAKILAGKGGGK